MSLRRRFRTGHVDLDAMPEPCRRRLPLISKHIDGELDGATLGELEAHLGSCRACRDARAEMMEANRSYRAVIPPAVAIPELVNRIAGASASVKAAGPVAGRYAVGKAAYGV